MAFKIIKKGKACVVSDCPQRREMYSELMKLKIIAHPQHAHMWCKYSNLNVQRVVHSSCELCMRGRYVESQLRAALRITGWTHAYAASCSAAALESPKRPAARANSMMRKGRRTRNRGAAGARGLRWGVPANASSLCGVCAGGSSARVGETCGGVASGEAPAEAVCGESHCA